MAEWLHIVTYCERTGDSQDAVQKRLKRWS